MNIKAVVTFICSFICSYAFADLTGLDTAIRAGKFSGELRNVMAFGSASDALREAGPLNNSRVASSALSLKYETGAYELGRSGGLKLGLAIQSGHDWELHDKDKGLSLTGGEDDFRASVTATSVQQAYLDYQFNRELSHSNVRLGRQEIISPLLMRSGFFPMRDAFDALVVTNRDITDTTIKLIYVDKWMMRYGSDASRSITQRDRDFSDPIWSLYINSKLTGNLHIEAQWLGNNNSDPVGDPPTNIATGPYESYFVALDYAIPDSHWVLGSKYLYADIEEGANASVWGVKADTRWGSTRVRFAHTSVDDNAGFPGTLGHVPMFRLYAFIQVDAELTAGVDATSVSLGQNFAIPGFDANLALSFWRHSEQGMRRSGADLDGGHELSLDMRYQFPSVEGLSGRMMLSMIDFDNADIDSDDVTYMRLYLNYAF